MPIYEYACDACHYRFEKFQPVSAEPVQECPKCKERKAKRLISPSNFHLKGGGWYKEGYSKESSANKEKKSPSASAPETAPTTSSV